MSRQGTAEDPGNRELWSRLEPGSRRAMLGLVRAWGNVQRWMEPHFRRYELSQPQFAVLMTLRRSPSEGITLTELARSIFVSNTNMTGLVDRLERDGLVARRRDPEDRRAQLVGLTPAGRQRLDRAWERHPAMIEAALSGLTKAERSLLGRLLEKLAESLSPRSAPAEARRLGRQGGSPSVRRNS